MPILPIHPGKEKGDSKREVKSGNRIKFGICSAAICAWEWRGENYEGDCLKSLLSFYERNVTGTTGNLGLHIVLGNLEVMENSQPGSTLTQHLWAGSAECIFKGIIKVDAEAIVEGKDSQLGLSENRVYSQ